MSKTKIIAGNWKMNANSNDAMHLVKTIQNQVLNYPTNNTVIVAPPFVYLPLVSNELNNNSSVKIAAQNCSQFNDGAYTGEVSATMLHDLNIPFVIIGHSERRQYFNEADEILLEKINQALNNNLKIIFCCGENLALRESNEYFSFIQNQLENTIFQLDENQIKNIIIAYEPIWAIGTGKTASPEQAQAIHAFIRALLTKAYGTDIAQQIPILYGGSVKPSNAKALLSCNDIDGALVGGASLNASDFIDIIYAI
ncbi:MAG: triose-phosphate isomerase [Chitinophagales bacterium]|nr:triose-phosphate isomerase [Chitinophagales bacterium]